MVRTPTNKNKQKQIKIKIMGTFIMVIGGIMVLIGIISIAVKMGIESSNK
jgi:hypothetical protein